MPLIRLIYRSDNALRVTGSRLLIHYHDIVSTARRRNTALGVTGFLMFDRALFHQVLEGPDQVVEDLFTTISADRRHTNVVHLEQVPIATRDFSDWSMASFLGDDRSHPLQQKHRIVANMPVEPDRLLAFARDFVAQEQYPD